MKRNATARWQGDLKTGKGQLSTDSGVLSKDPYSFATRFESGQGTNPEELIAAAHAGCFSMALSMILGAAGHTPDYIETKASVSLERAGDGFAITAVHLAVKAKVSGADSATFKKAANEAKEGCPVSKALRVDITMDAALEA